MASGITNRGRFMLLGHSFVAVTLPTNYYLALITSATAPTVDHNTFGEFTQIAVGNGYADGGYSLTPGGTDWDVHTEDDTNDLGKVIMKAVVWSASGGSIPDSGSGARWAVLTDDNATKANRQVLAWFDLTSDRTVSDGQDLTVDNSEMQLTLT